MSKEKDVWINPTYEEAREKEVLRCEEDLPDLYWDYRRRWNENPKKNIVEDFPLNLDLEVSSLCNLRCPMCARTYLNFDETDRVKSGFMEWSLFQKCIDEGSEYGLCAIKLNYMGEPLLHKDLPRMIRYAKDKGVLDVQFNTNGVLLRGKLAEEIIEAGVDKVIISFDSIKKERYEAIRVGAVFEDVVKNVEEFVKLRDKKGLKRPCVRVSMVKMKENLDEVDEFYKFWMDRGVDLVTYVNYVNHLGKDPEAEKRQIGYVEVKQEFICAQLWQRLFVLTDGRVTPCCGDIDGSCVLGNAYEDSLHDIWVGQALQRFRQLHWEGRFREMEICRRCHLPTTATVLKSIQ